MTEASRKLARLKRARHQVPDIDDATWCGLLKAYLLAEKRAVQVLGDYLEDVGQPRIKPGSDEKRLRRALLLLPPLRAHELACDFVEHALDQTDRGTLLRVRALPGVVAAKRAWLAGERGDDELKRERQVAQKLVDTRRSRLETARLEIWQLCQGVAHAASTSASAQIANLTSVSMIHVAGWRGVSNDVSHDRASAEELTRQRLHLIDRL